ncbi:rhythmically expressed gene 2 protein-like [Ostrinia nubilalis]|uniref:rhythmically expressed gene 2 protein-like n=1 Tax=Ostrinia nubilalis TaxID=29057 RepID=UPI0030824AB4
MSLRGIKLITFDATNTLLKFRVPPWQYYTLVARDHGFTGSEEMVRGCLLDSYKGMWDKYPNFGRSKITWEEWWTQVVKKTFEGHLPASANIDTIANTLINEFKTSKCWSVAPAGDRLLCLLQSQNKTVGVISNFDPRLNEILQSVKIKDFFNFIITSYQIGFSKPDERIFKHALEQCDKLVKPHEALHIGDDVEKDYEGAMAAGWRALLVSENIKSEIPPAEEHVFKNLEDLCLAIEQNKVQF